MSGIRVRGLGFGRAQGLGCGLRVWACRGKGTEFGVYGSGKESGRGPSPQLAATSWRIVWIWRTRHVARGSGGRGSGVDGDTWRMRQIARGPSEQDSTQMPLPAMLPVPAPSPAAPAHRARQRTRANEAPWRSRRWACDQGARLPFESLLNAQPAHSASLPPASASSLCPAMLMRRMVPAVVPCGTLCTDAAWRGQRAGRRHIRRDGQHPRAGRAHPQPRHESPNTSSPSPQCTSSNNGDASCSARTVSAAHEPKRD